ncbi:hypothetical protein AS032_34045 [Rhodococcus qingshengii]|nr:hypothetical protein AS032_34045 [Rhodococcus qingshengii]
MGPFVVIPMKGPTIFAWSRSQLGLSAFITRREDLSLAKDFSSAWSPRSLPAATVAAVYGHMLWEKVIGDLWLRDRASTTTGFSKITAVFVPAR